MLQLTSPYLSLDPQLLHMSGIVYLNSLLDYIQEKASVCNMPTHFFERVLVLVCVHLLQTTPSFH